MTKLEITYVQGVFFSLVPPLKVLSTKKLIQASLGVSRPWVGVSSSVYALIASILIRVISLETGADNLCT